MRVSDLSRTTGLSVATIKYYLREGLLHPGTLTARNQADYDETHVRRLRLIRVMMEVGGLGIAEARAVIDAIGNKRLPLHRVLGVAHHALGPKVADGSVPEDLVKARREIDTYLEGLGWHVSPSAPARHALADALVALRRLGRDVGPGIFDPYARAALDIAAHELSRIPEGLNRAEVVERVIVGTVVFEAALIALRRLAQEHQSALAADQKPPIAFGGS
jgi:DNA-binding transcriptional MerR regulator